MIINEFNNSKCSGIISIKIFLEEKLNPYITIKILTAAYKIDFMLGIEFMLKI